MAQSEILLTEKLRDVLFRRSIPKGGERRLFIVPCFCFGIVSHLNYMGWGKIDHGEGSVSILIHFIVLNHRVRKGTWAGPDQSGINCVTFHLRYHDWFKRVITPRKQWENILVKLENCFYQKKNETNIKNRFWISVTVLVIVKSKPV